MRWIPHYTKAEPFSTSTDVTTRAHMSFSTLIMIGYLFFFLNDTAPPEISPLSLPDALPIYRARGLPSGEGMFLRLDAATGVPAVLLEEHGYLTDFRTAAAVALTLKNLAPKDTHEALLEIGRAHV